MKKVVLVGGNGVIGHVLKEGLENEYEYEIYIMDKNIEKPSKHQIQVDATDYTDLVSKIPRDADVLINLLRIDVPGDLVDITKMNQAVDIHFKASYHLLNAAVELKIKKVIYSSSNHTTDYYEIDGYSTLNREINTDDYPYSRGLYGVLKLASENMGFAFSQKHDLSVINIRIGTVTKNEKSDLLKDDRLKRTLLTHQDTVNLYKCAIESDIPYGTYYGVSDNQDKPWSMEKTYKELSFESTCTTIDLINNKEIIK